MCRTCPVDCVEIAHMIELVEGASINFTEGSYMALACMNKLMEGSSVELAYMTDPLEVSCIGLAFMTKLLKVYCIEHAFMSEHME